jgi:ABC-type multidrug transport system permease subunit
MQQLTILYAFLRRDWLVTVSYRFPIVLELLGTFFSLALFFYLGDLVDPSTKSNGDLEGGYFAFAVIGLGIFRIGQIGLNAVGRKFREEQTTGTFEPLFSTSAASWLVVVGNSTFEILRATVLGIATVGLAVAFFGLRLTGDASAWMVVVISLVLAVVLFTALGVALGAFTVVFKQTTGIVGILLPGLALLSGVYFPVSLLPQPLQILSDLSPFTWVLDIVRGALLRNEIELQPLLILVPAAVVAIPIALAVFQAALNQARRAGSLAQY